MAAPAFYQVRTRFIGTLDDGTPVEYYEGEVVRADDPAFKKWGDLYFMPLVVRGAATGPVIEQATAAPGEKRGA